MSHCVAVASGKGGVGKTTVAVNLALAFVAQGYKVGRLDADIYGPSIPTVRAMRALPERRGEGMVPLEKFGLHSMSIGFLIDEDPAVVWRGPLASRMVNDFLTKVYWGELDYLIIDLPPGTGDPAIIVAKHIPDPAIVIVTTPQQVAIADVKKAINMFLKMDASVLGIVENMAYFCCEHSDEHIKLFGRDGGSALSEKTGIPLSASLPIDLKISRGGDAGLPLMHTEPDSDTGKLFYDIARQVAEACAETGTVR